MDIKIILQTFLVTTILLSSPSCKKDEEQSLEEVPRVKPKSTSINKILPLGASRVQGLTPFFESYRYELWKDLTENNFTFDFIGTNTDNSSYPLVNTNSFDPDHEGRSGWTSGQILEDLNNWLTQTGPPDIVLFSSPGGNDVLNSLDYDSIVTNVYSIIEIIQSMNPNVTILIEQPAPGKSDFMTEEYTIAFEKMSDDVVRIALEKTTSSSKVIPVDMYTGFTDSLLADDIHYNAAGADFIGARYFEKLIEVLE